MKDRIFLIVAISITLLMLAWLTATIVRAQDVATVHKALTALYKSTNGDQWRNNTGWDTTAVPASMLKFDQWYGIKVTSSNNNFRLSSNNQAIKFSIDLSKNKLNGTLPPEIGNLTNLLFLDLEYNQLFGSIPPEIGNLTRLDTLDLSNNKLSGSIPPEIGNLTNLLFLDLDVNNLSGSIPPEIGGLINVKTLWISENELTGRIPPEIGNLTELIFLDLRYNKLKGPIPAEMGNLESIEALWINYNELTGSLPPELGNLSNLDDLDLSFNFFTGSLPPELGNLSNLDRMQLRYNEFTDPIPHSFIQLNIRWFEFYNNVSLCAPTDDVFQDWLSTISFMIGPNCITGVAIENNPETDDIQIYPNPVIDYVTFKNVPYDTEIEIFDVLGRKVLSTNKRHIDMSELAHGLYVYIISSENKRVSGKLIKH